MQERDVLISYAIMVFTTGEGIMRKGQLRVLDDNLVREYTELVKRKPLQTYYHMYLKDNSGMLTLIPSALSWLLAAQVR